MEDLEIGITENVLFLARKKSLKTSILDHQS